MSEVARRARVRMILADYASIDAGGKLNMVGGGLLVVGHDPQQPVTNPFALALYVDFDHRDIGETASVEVVLEDGDGTAVTLPGAMGPLGQPQTIAIAQTHEIDRPKIPGVQIPRAALRPQMAFVLNLSTGIPLEVGHRYQWRVKIDHHTQDEWVLAFFTAGGHPGIVFGGGAGPADIPIA